MFRFFSLQWKYLIFFVLCAPLHMAAPAQKINESIVSEHVRLRIPSERQWLGRDTISDIERCWKFVNASTGEKLPRKVLVNVSWSDRDVRTDPESASIAIGMDNPAAEADPKSYLLKTTVREISRMGLLELSRGASQRESHEFLIEGMAEILAREWDRTTRNLAGAWVIAHYLDKMKQLGFAVQAEWAKFFDGRHTLRTAAPGVTFLSTCRELHGRDRTAKLFEGLKKGNLEDALATTFRSPAPSLENAWIQKVKAYNDIGDYTATAAEEAPTLQRATPIPAEVHAGAKVQLRLFLSDSGGNLLPDGVFVEDVTSGGVFQAVQPAEKEAKYLSVEVPVDAGCQAGQHKFRVIAVDETGNVRHWDREYTVRR